jgi:hypothetical protein
VRNPIPHEICIVRRIAGRQRISPGDFPIKIDAIRINNP